jgi:hypothetical protein
MDSVDGGFDLGRLLREGPLPVEELFGRDEVNAKALPHRELAEGLPPIFERGLGVGRQVAPLVGQDVLDRPDVVNTGGHPKRALHGALDPFHQARDRTQSLRCGGAHPLRAGLAELPVVDLLNRRIPREVEPPSVAPCALAGTNLLGREPIELVRPSVEGGERSLRQIP